MNRKNFDVDGSSISPDLYTKLVDFNMDKVCEYIGLADGTTIANPLVQATSTPAPMS